MKKSRLAKKFLEELRKTPVVSAVCAKLNLSRQSVYRWLDEDDDFRKEYDLFLSHGIDNINDLAESKLISKVQDGEMRAIVYWLENNKRTYYRPKLPLSPEPPYQGVTQFNIQLYQGDKKKTETFNGEVKPEEKIVDKKTT